jgi:hypothetical protein
MGSSMNVAVGDQWRIAQAERVRESMGPDFQAVADELRTVFSARLVWFESGTLTMGKPLESSEPIGEKSWRGKRVA